LSGYAVSYNLRHRRHGHVFQNRYKSILCDGDSYFTELVRYIDLNPLRVESASSKTRMQERCDKVQRRSEIVTPNVSWLSQLGRLPSDGSGE
jgi:hypothetical protein